ncbi:FliI/YscN family ATPase [Bartonella ancashensis]|uniref:Flagellum-specific ATP synthase FliI n=1 Tax=Bartonella ancashensis TaxID=1318743 RepID=A0A0M3T2J8_9HYPH|nr:FliI/YscN family ATPase [Bartonella ancashensis]ALE02971.1 Flagellum-specific ATP synthase FliI [Bartonella ancashensis]
MQNSCNDSVQSMVLDSQDSQSDSVRFSSMDEDTADVGEESSSAPFFFQGDGMKASSSSEDVADTEERAVPDLQLSQEDEIKSSSKGKKEKTASSTALSRLSSFVTCNTFDHFVSQGGVINDISRGILSARGLSQSVFLGDMVRIECGNQTVRGEVIHVNEDNVLIKPYDETIAPILNASVFPQGPLVVAPDRSWRGRVLNAFGEAIDGNGVLLSGSHHKAVETIAPPALERNRVGKGLCTGVKVVDIFTPLCFGQRIGIFSGSGVGKSTLLSMMMKANHFDTVVLALTGERGREVRDMLDDTLQNKLDNIVTVIATGDESPMMRRLAPIMATTIAEYFSSLGDNVLLVVDSITRYALAVREIAISAHEPPVARGFPPRVFSELPRLLERAGPGRENKGSITGIYAVLVDGDDHNDPVSDAIRGILDGHIVLDRAIAAQGRFPAVDITSSISRLAVHSWTPEQRILVQNLKEMIFRYEETRDLRAMGAYRPGADQVLDKAVCLVPSIYAAMNQSPDTPPISDPYDELARLLKSQ